mgnify:FL=1
MPEPKLIEQVLNVASPTKKATGKIIEPAQKTISLFLAEEQQILKEAYISFFQDQRSVNILGTSDDTSSETLVAAVKAHNPDAILLGVKSVQKDTIQKLDDLRQACPNIGIVLLFSFYDA